MAACARNPAAIAPVSMGGAFNDVSCKRAAQLYQQEAAKVPGLVSRQKQAVAGDAVGVFLIGVPASSLTGGDLEGEISATKGKLVALEARVQACGGTVQPVSWG